MKCRALIGLLFLIVPLVARAQNAVPNAGKCGPKNDQLVISGKPGCDDIHGKAKDPCELGDQITVSLDADCLSAWEDADKTRNNPRKLVLVLNGHVLKGTYSDPLLAGTSTLRFDLRRRPDNPDNRQAWNALLSRAPDRMAVKVSVALEDGTVRYGDTEFTLKVVPDGWGWVAAFFILMLVTFGVLVRWSGIIRDPGPQQFYSLARTQMAFWFFIVIAAYLYIWVITGDRDTLTSGALALIGISAATGLGAVVAGSNPPSSAQANTQWDALAKERDQLVADLEKQKDTDKEARLTKVKEDLAKLGSQGWLLDLLSEETGVSFHRFQMVVWTLVLGIVFVVAVYQDLAMPDFSTTLLGLVGISGGTYVGGKLVQAK
jgi:hypothetical protein